MDNIPEGLKFLQGPQQTEKKTKAFLANCCANHQLGCECESLCKKWYDKRATADYRRGGWAFSSRRLDKKDSNRYQTDTERYADSLPVLSSRIVLNFARERLLRVG